MFYSRKPVARAHATRGMTLMELSVVLIIILVLVGVALPNMTGMNQKNKLRAAARELVACTKLARTEAVFGERMTEVFLDLEKRQFWIDLRTPDEKTGEYNPRSKKSQMELKRDLETGRAGARKPDIWFDEVTTYDSNIIKDKIIAIDFYPDGSASPTLFTLTNTRGAKLTVEVLKATGQTEITPGTIEEKKAKEEEERQQVLGEVFQTGVPSE